MYIIDRNIKRLNKKMIEKQNRVKKKENKIKNI